MLKTLLKKDAQVLMNKYGKAAIPFLFVIDYEQKQSIVLKLDELDEAQIRYCFYCKNEKRLQHEKNVSFEFSPVSFSEYSTAYDIVQQNIQAGNTYLTNLTFPTRVLSSLSLLDIFDKTEAKYKLWMKDRFVVFSPEPFVKIEKGKISSFPMKGTIDANVYNAREELRANSKEKAEHATIVDLIRNDLSQVSTNVKVEQYRYFERIETGNGALIQSSSHISGQLPADYESRLGDIIFKLLPAGSITGAPKKKTVEIIESAESCQRDFYTGVFGVFDGKKMDSSVAIRFIEKDKNGLIFKSGGGITAFSDAKEEYEELIGKIYLPIKNAIHEKRYSLIGNH